MSNKTKSEKKSDEAPLRIAEAIGSKSLIRKAVLAHFWPGFASAIGSRSQSPLPVILTAFRHGEFELLDQIKIPLSWVLHGEQEYKVTRTLLLNDELAYQTEFTRYFTRSGSSEKLTFLIFETRFWNQVEVARGLTTMILRNFEEKPRG